MEIASITEKLSNLVATIISNRIILLNIVTIIKYSCDYNKPCYNYNKPCCNCNKLIYKYN